MKRLLLGMVAACMATAMGAQDPATYEKAGEYTLENLWMKAATTGNNMGVADQLGGANDSRGMTVKGDEMLFAYRAAFTGIKIYDFKHKAYLFPNTIVTFQLQCTVSKHT